MEKKNVFFVLFIILGLFVAGLVVFVQLNSQYNSYKSDFFNKIRTNAVEKTNLIDNFISDQEDIFYQVYDEKLFRDFLKLNISDKNSSDYIQKKKVLLDLFYSHPAAVMGLINSTGEFIVDSEGALEGFDIKSYPEGVDYFYNGSNKIYYMVLPHPFLDSYYILTPKKILDSGGNFLGIFSYRVPDSDLRVFLSDLVGLDGESESYLVDSKYDLLTPSKFLGGSSGILLQTVNTTGVTNCFSFPEKEGNIFEYLSYNGQKVFGTYEYIQKPGWCLIVETNRKDLINKFIHKCLWKLILTFVLILVIFIFIAFYVRKNYFVKKKH
jgi:hypothetical protein